MSSWRSLVALGVLNLLGMLMAATTGFGENVTFQLGWYCMSLFGWSSGSLAESVAILTIISLPLYCLQAAKTHHMANHALACVFAVTSLVEMVGPFMLSKFDNVGLKRALGFILIVLFIWRAVLEQRFNGSPPDIKYEVCTRWHLPASMFAGTMSAALGGLFSCPGPPAMMFILIANIGKDEWRGTSAVYSLLELPLRLVSIFVFDRANLNLQRLSMESAVSFACGLVGLILGNCVAPHVSQSYFRVFILFLLLFGGLVLLTAGTGALTLKVIISALVLVALFFIAIFSRRIYIKRRHPTSASDAAGASLMDL